MLVRVLPLLVRVPTFLLRVVAVLVRLVVRVIVVVLRVDAPVAKVVVLVVRPVAAVVRGFSRFPQQELYSNGIILIYAPTTRPHFFFGLAPVTSVPGCLLAPFRAA